MAVGGVRANDVVEHGTSDQDGLRSATSSLGKQKFDKSKCVVKDENDTGKEWRLGSGEARACVF